MSRRSCFLSNWIWACLAIGCATPRSSSTSSYSAHDRDSTASTIPDVPETQVPIASYRLARQISMFYRLDLRKDNAHSLRVAAAMREHDNVLRDCYMKRLDDSPQLRGNVELTFALSKTAQAFTEINHVGGSMKDKSLVGCLKQRLAEIPFSPPHDIHGSLNYSFNYTISRLQSK